MNKVIIVCLLLAAVGTIDVQGEDLCVCQLSYVPVCVGTTTFGNICQAQCVHGGAVQFSDGPCPQK